MIQAEKRNIRKRTESCDVLIHFKHIMHTLCISSNKDNVVRNRENNFMKILRLAAAIKNCVFKFLLDRTNVSVQLSINSVFGHREPAEINHV